MLKLVLPGLVVSALCACDAGQSGGVRQLPPDRPTWSTTFDAGQTPGQARLAYGLPQTDAVVLAFDCRPHSGQVTVSGPLAPGASRLVLSSGGVVDEINGRSEPDPQSGLNLMSGLADARDAALAAFARTGLLTRIDPGGATALPALGAQKAQVRRFLDACAR